jgi:cardiolipin synthase
LTATNLILALHVVMVISFTLRILLRDDFSPPARLAWFVVLTFLPFVGSVAYFLFGEINNGENRLGVPLKTFGHRHQNARSVTGHPETIERVIDPLYQPTFSYAGSINGYYPVMGNAAALMADGLETRQRLVADIDAAKEHVHVLYYIWLDDNTGTDIAEALIRAAQRGVTCRAMADGLGSRALIKSALWRRMKEAGVQVAVALSLKRLVRTVLTSRIDLRNHRKITVIDGMITYCGSRNAADPEFLVKAKYAPWVDIMLRLEGPVAAQNQLLFSHDWARGTGEELDAILQSAKPVDGGFPAQVTGHGPTERRASTPQLFTTAIACARNSLTLSTPYFVPDSTVLEALCSAAFRGVRVTLIFPKVNDSWIVAAASRSFYKRLIEAGCTIYEFKGGLLHAKTLTIDDMVSLIGSSNLDLRSFDLNYENNILMQDEALTKDIRERQSDYIARSEQVTLAEVAQWPYRKRIWYNVIATIGPIL